ncbi:MAG TPA: putative sulfate exporter family transporter [Phnomibacter sp.]|nr:putative sulfate exporter family transporter [Phnomibacter sp.]
MTEFAKKGWRISEDWAVVLLGGILLVLVVAGVPFPMPSFGWANGNDLAEKVFSGKNIGSMLFLLLITLAIAAIGAIVTQKPLQHVLKAIPILVVITIAASILAGNKSLSGIGLETVIFSLLLGLLIRNLFQLPEWLVNNVSAEFYVKIGLVLLGTNIIFGDILKAGLLGIVQSLVVVLSVWYFAFWLCKKYKVDTELSLMISSAVSICGVSAAIATAGAIKGDNKKLSYVISLVLVCAIPMLIGMPYIAKWLQLSPEVTGAWLGGTIDTTGAVVASGALVGEEALKMATIVKFSQNVLLGLAAFAISVYWTYIGKGDLQDERRVSYKVLWERFPKFVIGFILASLFFSFVVSSETVAAAKPAIKSLQNLWFALAFTGIGLETRFSDLFKEQNSKALKVFLVAQLFNVLITLLVASLLFAHSWK